MSAVIHIIASTFKNKCKNTITNLIYVWTQMVFIEVKLKKYNEFTCSSSNNFWRTMIDWSLNQKYLK